jgi:5-formyltetrahydrofolate cyclo-ligase
MSPSEVTAWRRAERERLLAARMALPVTLRREAGEQIAKTLQNILAERPGVLGIYWPFRAEFDPRPLVDALVAAGRKVALPVVIDKKGRSNIAFGDPEKASSPGCGTSRSPRSVIL